MVIRAITLIDKLFGFYFITAQNPCSSNPCQIHATCMNMYYGYQCLCSNNYFGRTCSNGNYNSLV